MCCWVRSLDRLTGLKDIITTKYGRVHDSGKELDPEPLPSEMIPPLQFWLLTVRCPQTLTSDGESLDRDALCVTAPDHLVGAEFI